MSNDWQNQQQGEPNPWAPQTSDESLWQGSSLNQVDGPAAADSSTEGSPSVTAEQAEEDRADQGEPQSQQSQSQADQGQSDQPWQPSAPQATPAPAAPADQPWTQPSANSQPSASQPWTQPSANSQPSASQPWTQPSANSQPSASGEPGWGQSGYQQTYAQPAGDPYPQASANPYPQSSADPQSQNQYGQSQYGQDQYGQAQYGQAQYGQSQYGQAQYPSQAQYGQGQYSQDQYSQNQYADPTSQQSAQNYVYGDTNPAPGGYSADPYAAYGYQQGGMVPYGANPNAPYGIDPVSGLPFSDKQKTTAGILQILLGSLGVGRFYTGHTGLGIAQLAVTIVTFGIGAIWGLVDGILMLTGNPKDAQGRPLR
jgi:TM2 domain-containing membrane protein YozV